MKFQIIIACLFMVSVLDVFAEESTAPVGIELLDEHQPDSLQIVKIDPLNEDVDDASSASKQEDSYSFLDDIYRPDMFYFYSVEDRIRVLNHLKEELKAGYVSLALKEKRLNLDVDKIFRDACDFERQLISQSSPLREAKANLDFLDRVQKIIAMFKDTHLAVAPISSLPLIANGLVLARDDDRFVIKHVIKHVLDYMAALSEDKLLGEISENDEVLSIDGRSVNEVVNDLKPYFGGSSEAFRDEKAVTAITLRRVKYPKKPEQIYTIRLSRGQYAGKVVQLKIPLFYFSENSRKDALLYLNQLGFYNGNSLRINFSPLHGRWVELPTFQSVRDAAFAKPGEVLFESVFSDFDKPAYRLGFIVREGKIYGYMQIFTFSAKEVEQAGRYVDFFRPITSFIKSLKKLGVPLILDLRFNVGGHASFPGKLLSHLAREGEEYAPITFGFRVTPTIRQVVESLWSRWDRFRKESVQYVEEAVAKGWQYTRLLEDDVVKPSLEVGGYNEEIVMMTSPKCVSACDAFAIYMKTSGRAHIIGKPTNGTGDGYFDPYFGMSSWSDPGRILHGNLPNISFGFPKGSLGVEIPLPEDELLTYSSENRPVEPHVAIKNNNISEWLNIAIETIENKGPVLKD